MNGNVIVPATGDAQRSDAPRKSSSSGTLRFLVFCEDPNYLKVFGDKLQDCQYEVMRCSTLDNAMDILKQNKGRFDILLSDGVVDDIHKFELLKRVGNDVDISVATIMSGEDDAQMTIKCIFCGSCYILNGPKEREVLRNWQHIHRKGSCTSKDSAQIRNPDIDGRGRLQEPFEDSDQTSSKSETKLKSSRNEEEENIGEHEPTPPSRKQRLWVGPLQQKFLWAINQLGGIEKGRAAPKKIWELMKVDFPELTIKQVTSHLQKERLKQDREKETRERNGESHELSRDENSRNINMAGGPQHHPPRITGNRGQVISSNGPLPVPLLQQQLPLDSFDLISQSELEILEAENTEDIDFSLLPDLLDFNTDGQTPVINNSD